MRPLRMAAGLAPLQTLSLSADASQVLGGGKPIALIATKFFQPSDLAVDRAGNLYTADLKGGNGASARFLTPQVIGVDNDDNPYLYDKWRAAGRPPMCWWSAATAAHFPTKPWSSWW